MKYAKNFQIGRIDPKDSRISKENLTQGEASSEKEKLLKEVNIKDDFATLRKVAKKMGYFNPSYFYFFLQALQIVGLHVLGYYILWNYGYSALPLSIATICLIVAQVNVYLYNNYKHLNIDFLIF